MPLAAVDFGFIFVLIHFLLLQIAGLSSGQSRPYSTLLERHSSTDGASEREGERNFRQNGHRPPLPPRYVPKFSRFTPFQTVESLPGPQFGRPSLAPPPRYKGNFGSPPSFGRHHPFEGYQPSRGHSRPNFSQTNSRERAEENERNFNENGKGRGENIKNGGGGQFGNNFGKETSDELPSTFPRPSYFEGQHSSAENISSNPTAGFGGKSIKIDEANIKKDHFLNSTTPSSTSTLSTVQPSSSSSPQHFVNSTLTSSSSFGNKSSQINEASNQSTTLQHKYSPLQIRPNVPYGPELVARLASQNFWSPTEATTIKPNEKAAEEEKVAENEGNRRFSGENENGSQKWKNGPSKVFFTPPSNGRRFGPDELEKNSKDDENRRNSRENEANKRREQFGGESSIEEGRPNGKRRPFGGFSRESEVRPAIGQFQRRRGHSHIVGSGEDERRRNSAENSREFGGNPPKARPPPPRRWGSEENRQGIDRPNSRENWRNSREQQQQSNSSEGPSHQFVGNDGNTREGNNNGGGGKHHRPFVPPKGIPNPGEFLPEHIRNAFPPFPEPFEQREERNRPRGGGSSERKRRDGEVHHKRN